jgi:hypothetical protein
MRLEQFVDRSSTYRYGIRAPFANVATQQGNQTKSAEVNNLIKKVEKCEVRHVGAPSKARRAAKMNAEVYFNELAQAAGGGSAAGGAGGGQPQQFSQT